MTEPPANKGLYGVSRLDSRVKQACEAVGEFIEYWGFKSIYGRVWALLAMHRQPLTQVEIAEALGVSRALISGAVAELRFWGLLRPTRDHRNAPYEAVIDVWSSVSEVLRTREWMMLEASRTALEAALSEAEAEVARGRSIPWDLDRLRLLLKMTEAAQTLLKMMLTIRVPGSIEGFSKWIGRVATLMGGLRTR